MVKPAQILYSQGMLVWGETAKKYSMTPLPPILWLELRFMDVCTLLCYLPHVLDGHFFHRFFFSSYMRIKRSLDTPSSSHTRNVSGASLAGGPFFLLKKVTMTWNRIMSFFLEAIALKVGHEALNSQVLCTLLYNFHFFSRHDNGSTFFIGM